MQSNFFSLGERMLEFGGIRCGFALKGLPCDNLTYQDANVNTFMNKNVININTIATGESKYLKVLSDVDKSVKSLYFSGNIPQNRVKTVSIVGSRKPTDYGREVAYKFAYELARRGVVIVSGLAIGIDTIAHEATLKAGGTTIAVLPAGLDKIYPSSNYTLATRIITERGCLITEYPYDTTPFKSNFVKRSRIVTGISDGLLVVEASAKSGTLHTAAFAKRQGRVVMAVPGKITSKFSEGSNTLIKNGAKLISSTDDILQAIGHNQSVQSRLPFANDPTEQIVIDLLAMGSKSTQQLIKQSGLGSAELSRALTTLEISDKVRLLANAWVLN